MAIRFRCAYCSQLMAIATRKQGAIVRCPRCSGQVVVPAPSDVNAAPTSPQSTDATMRSVAGAPSVLASPFQFDDFEVLNESPPASEANCQGTGSADVSPVSGIFLSTWQLVLAGLLIIVLVLSAFFLGRFLGRM